MPELPEVETVRRGLEPVLTGQRLAHVEQRRPDLRWPLPDRFAERLTGREVLRARRRSKWLMMDLDDDQTWMIHLGMSGRMLIEGRETADLHHPRAVDRAAGACACRADLGRRDLPFAADPRALADRRAVQRVLERFYLPRHRLCRGLDPVPSNLWLARCETDRSARAGRRNALHPRDRGQNPEALGQWYPGRQDQCVLGLGFGVKDEPKEIQRDLRGKDRG